MAATVIDALLITLGLDTSDFRKGQKDVSDDLKKQREDAKKTAKEMAEQGKKAAAFFGSIKTELLALTGVTVTAGGLMSLVKNTTSSLMELSVQAKALGMTAKELDGVGKAAEAAGSSVEKINAALQGFQSAKEQAKSGVYNTPVTEAAIRLNSLTHDSFNVRDDSVQTTFRKILESARKVTDPDIRRQILQSVGIDDAVNQRNQEGQFLPDVDRLTKSSGITDASTKGAKEFTAAWAELNQSLETTKNQFYTFLIPYVRDFNVVLRDLSNWMKSHPEEMKQKVDAFFGAIESGAKMADKAAQAVGGWENAIKIIIGASVGGKLLFFLTNLSKSLLGLARITLPGWLVAAAGLSAADKVDDLNQKAKESGVDVGTYLVGKMKEKQKENAEAFDKHFDYSPSGMELSPQQQATQKMLDAVKFQPLPEQRRQQQDERDYWESTKNLLSKIADALISPAGAATMQPDTSGYQPNVPLNAQTARLGAKGKAFLQAMAGEFGALEGKYDLPAGLLSSVAATESGGDPYAVSPKGAKGPFQFMDGTARDLGLKGMDVYDPHKSADAAARYLRYLLDATGGDLEKTLASYNWGLGNVQKKGMDNLPSETRNYVPKVMAGMRPGAGMAVDRAMPGQSGATYQFYGTKITTQARNVEQLTSDIKKHGDNRVMLLAGYSGQ
ncbi:lytic transglycosylase domain-containing protein [Klebsiella pneumoniae]|uniref:lytic transglycosylase domain-containing protein n=3 Tax=Klebsiella pneumoniae TaxID=573 RepID=UPI001FAC743A|nr:lytic transglycosylase domain-containing protein [Klebsiella pneumoniae]MCI7891458.1 lytic transglycosylase domain-containing protein [Klebsiella pneumoniae]MCI7941365.1 lytic transglycosylase domain-containing protein [Klebsiella pneumoniae]MCI7956830.1 lytic transglycosylase domain-containing protein [Klebsiella pneumoniae]MCI8000261.1 lytic transglycosylase domain-containing protein [Klebsiella pneumoniae]MCI8247062.1 lytic transglycosylase domain-containing protein [Klebsiella pneumonia